MMSYQEFLLWCAYIEKHGSLNIGDRVEQSSAIVAVVQNNLHSKRQRKVSDFMPHYAKQEDTVVLTPAATLGRLQALAKPETQMRLRKDK